MIDFLNIADYVSDYDGLVVVGDIHGNWSEFEIVINNVIENNLFLLSLGDVIDYGPENIKCFNELNKLIIKGQALMLIGNHEFKMFKYINQSRENNLRIRRQGGILKTIENMEELSQTELIKFEDDFLDTFQQSCYIAKYGNYYFAHGSIDPNFWTNHTFAKATKSMAMFGQVDTKSEPRPDGYPIRRYEWVDSIPKECIVVVGHDIRDKSKPFQQNGLLGGKAIFLDTGSSKGGQLSSMTIAS